MTDVGEMPGGPENTGGVDTLAPGEPADAWAVAIGREAAIDSRGRRRFVLASAAGTGMAAVPFLWILWSLWTTPSFFRKLDYQANFYDLQARAMLHGGLAIPQGSIGVEGFLHGGKTYTYFGLFPSILRMPILAVSHAYDGRLTTPSILLGWLVSAVFFILLAWRVRVLVRGAAAVGWAEATSFGLLTFTFLGGSTFLWLASTPYVFSEDLVWSVALTVGCLFFLLGVADRPSWWRVGGSGLFMVLANQNRSTTGWAMVVGAFLLAGWFLLGRGGEENKRWGIPLAVVAVVALVLGSLVNYAKFGMFFGLPIDQQIYSMVNAYRRKFLASNHNSEVGTTFIPSNLLAYLRPDGIQFSSVFPFVTLPSSPPSALGGVLFDRLYRTASLPASMPLLSGLSIWGLVSAFRTRPPARVARTRLLLLAAGSAGAALMLWGYIGPRYLADFLPFLAIGSTVGMADIWRRQDGKDQVRRILVTSVITVVAVYSVAANFGIAVTPSEEWTPSQTLTYVQAQQAWSNGALKHRVVRTSTLPAHAPAGQIRIIGVCNAMYISNGEDYSADPTAQFGRKAWQTVQYGHAFEHTFSVTPYTSTPGAVVPLVKAGSWMFSVQSTPLTSRNLVQLTFPISRTGVGLPRVYRSFRSYKRVNRMYTVVVVTDPLKHVGSVSIDGAVVNTVTLVDGQPIQTMVTAADASQTSGLSVVDVSDQTPQPNLCLSLLR